MTEYSHDEKVEINELCVKIQEVLVNHNLKCISEALRHMGKHCWYRQLGLSPDEIANAISREEKE